MSGFFATGVQFPIKALWKTRVNFSAVSYWWLAIENLVISSDSSIKNVLVMFPGNPGVPEYYIDFLSKVYNLTSKKIDIIIVGHLGQSIVSDSQEYSDDLFDLQSQVSHKLDCIDEIVEKYPEGTKIFLAGHSVGAWLCEQVVKKRPNIKFTQIFSLFPAICKLRESPKGVWMSKYLFPPTCRKAAAFFISGLNLLSPFILVNVARLITKQSDSSLQITVEKVIKSGIAENCLLMAHDEMCQIYELDTDFYKEKADMFTFYYGTEDKWVPLECYREMKTKVPGVNVNLCQKNMPHAFVLSHSDDMAEILSCWLHKYL